jgi:hypothetical protein
LPEGGLAPSEHLRWTKPGIGDFTERRLPGRIDAVPSVTQLPDFAASSVFLQVSKAMIACSIFRPSFDP